MPLLRSLLPSLALLGHAASSHVDAGGHEPPVTGHLEHCGDPHREHQCQTLTSRLTCSARLWVHWTSSPSLHPLVDLPPAFAFCPLYRTVTSAELFGSSFAPASVLARGCKVKL